VLGMVHTTPRTPPIPGSRARREIYGVDSAAPAQLTTRGHGDMDRKGKRPKAGPGSLLFPGPFASCSACFGVTMSARDARQTPLQVPVSPRGRGRLRSLRVTSGIGSMAASNKPIPRLHSVVSRSRRRRSARSHSHLQREKACEERLLCLALVAGLGSTNNMLKAARAGQPCSSVGSCPDRQNGVVDGSPHLEALARP
jgi:hypothetical protein